MIKVVAASPNGWWYGSKINSISNNLSKNSEIGFFPGNYVKTLQSGDKEFQKQNELKIQVEKLSTNQTQTKPSEIDKFGGSYSSYVDSTFADKEQVIFLLKRI